MLNFFKINSEHRLEWDENPQDFLTFIVIVAVKEHEFGVSTYILCNRKQQSIVASKFEVLGLSTINVVSQFNIKIETGVKSLNGEMKVVGLNALRVFLELKRKYPFIYADLKRVSEAANPL